MQLGFKVLGDVYHNLQVAGSSKIRNRCLQIEQIVILI